MWDISELNLSLLFLSEINKYVKSMFEFSDAENIIKSFFCFLSAFFFVFTCQYIFQRNYHGGFSL